MCSRQQKTNCYLQKLISPETEITSLFPDNQNLIGYPCMIRHSLIEEMLIKTIFKTLGLSISIAIILATLQCANKTASTNSLPKDIFGISVGMNKGEAQKRLEEIAQFVSEDRKTGQLWEMKNEPRFKHVAVGYDAENKINFVTALADKATAKERMRFSDVGDLSAALKEVVGPHHKYFWDVPANEGKPAYKIFIYGSDPEFLTIYSLSELSLSKKDKPDESEKKE